MKKRTANAWDAAELEALIALYGRMLDLQRLGKLGRGPGQISKASLVRGFLADHAAAGRTKSSVECKLMNISHCRKRRGWEIVAGYKPLANVGADLLARYRVRRETAAEREARLESYDAAD